MALLQGRTLTLKLGHTGPELLLVLAPLHKQLCPMRQIRLRAPQLVAGKLQVLALIQPLLPMQLPSDLMDLLQRLQCWVGNRRALIELVDLLIQARKICGEVPQILLDLAHDIMGGFLRRWWALHR